MSGKFRCQVTIPMDSGLPEDSIVNVWHFDSDQTFSEDADDVAGRLAVFYQAIDSVLFPAQVSTPATIKVYDLADAEPRIPGYETTFALVPGASLSAIPFEVAACLSMEGARVSGANMRRRRGRIYLGPCSVSAMDTTSPRVTLSSATRTAIVNAAVALATGPDVGDGRLAVFSPTTWAEEGGTAADLDAAFEDVVRVWVDDAPDTMRSRGTAPTTRTIGLIP